MGAEESGDDGSCMSLLQHARRILVSGFRSLQPFPAWLVAYDVVPPLLCLLLYHRHGGIDDGTREGGERRVVLSGHV